MKKILIMMTLLTSLSVSANWSNIFNSVNFAGCAAGGVLGYATQLREPIETRLQVSTIGCATGAFFSWLIDRNMASRYAKKERDDKEKLARILREYRRQDASNISEDPTGRYYLEKSVVPSRTHSDGSISLEHLRLRLKSSGSDVLLGD